MQKVKKRKGKTKVWIIVIAIVVGVIVLVLAGGYIFTAPGRNELKNMVIDDVDFSSLSDGVYTGTYRGTKDKLRNTGVEVTVASGKVTQIRVTEGGFAGENQSNEIQGGKSLDDLFGEVIDSQSLQVDAISGATLTGKAYLSAVEDALEKAESH